MCAEYYELPLDCAERDAMVQILVENILDVEEGQLLSELNRTELMNMIDTKSRERGQRVNKVELESSSIIGTNVLTTWKVATQTGTRSERGGLRRYQVLVQIDKWKPIIDEHGGKLKEHAKFLKTADIKVFCSCQKFFFGGSKFNLGIHSDVPRAKDSLVRGRKYGYKGRTKDGRSYEEEYDVTVPPNIRDPHRTNFGCKHLVKVLQVLPFSISSMIGKIQRKGNLSKVERSKIKSNQKKLIKPTQPKEEDE